jgi:phage shock protein C
MRKLYRDRESKLLAGVCSGIAKTYDLDVSIIRGLWLLSLLTGIGLLAYIAAALIIPQTPAQGKSEDSEGDTPSVKRILGLVLIGLGIFLFIYEIGLIEYLYYDAISWSFVWGLALILLGIVLLFRPKKDGSDRSNDFWRPVVRPLDERMIFGVCAGLARHFQLETSLLRVFFAVAIISSHGLGLLVYALMAIVFPSEAAITGNAEEFSGGKNA